MILLFIVVLSYIIGVISFFLKNKRYTSIMALLSISTNIGLLLREGVIENYFIGQYIGDFGFFINDLNLAFVITILAVTITSSLYSTRYMEERFRELGVKENWGAYYGLFSLFAISMIDVVISTNLIELYLFLEVSLVTSFLLILLYGYGNKRRISVMYFIWTHIGTVLLLASILTLIFVGPYHSADIYNPQGAFVTYPAQGILEAVFIVAVFGMMIKAAMFLFNTWLPYAHGEAPTPISVLLSPNTVGLGVFVIILYFYLFPSMNFISPLFVGWAIITMIYGGIMATTQRDFKKFLAYSSVSQMGYMMLGASLAFQAGLSNQVYPLPLGILASVFFYASHGLGKAIMFMSAGASITEYKTRDIQELGGLFSSSPLYSTLSFLGLLNLLGLPPTIGVISEILLLLEAGKVGIVAGEGYFLGVLLGLFVAIGISSAYTTYLFKRVYGGEGKRHSIDGVVDYILPMGILAVVSILLFLYPSILATSFDLYFQVLPTSSVLLPLIVILPAIASLISLLTPKTLNQDIRGALSVLLNFTAFGISLYLFLNGNSEPAFSFSYFTFSMSRLQGLLATVVSGLSSFISLYSIGYMKEDNVLRRYWGFFEFFVMSMLMVVIGGNIFTFLVGWEGTSLASYGLISYWLNDNRDSAVGVEGKRVFGVPTFSLPTVSGIRAMIFTRVGDVGLVIGLGALLLFSANTLLYVQGGLLQVGLQGLIHSPLTSDWWWLVFFVLLLGGLSKSAQFPFTQWLLTAMTGPTPVSALIHAATMVNLGAFITFFFFPYLSPYIGLSQTHLLALILTFLSGFTILYTSVGGLVSNESKVVLAYSTADQISFMIFSSSLGLLLASQTGNPVYISYGIGAGIVQFIAHGIYKATLFMNAGSVIHYTGSRFLGSSRMLAREIPIIFLLQTVAALNLADFPYLLGYWGHQGVDYLSAQAGFDIVTDVAAVLGTLYVLRLIIKTFLWPKTNHLQVQQDKEEEGHEGHHIHPLMYVSPAILATVTVVLGVFYSAVINNVRSSIQLSTSFSDLYFLDPFVLFLFMIGLVMSLPYTRGFQRPNSLQTLTDVLDAGWGLHLMWDFLGYSYPKFSTTLYSLFERNTLDRLFNEVIPDYAVRVGRFGFKIQGGVIRNYVGAYAVGLFVLFFIVLLFLLG